MSVEQEETESEEEVVPVSTKKQRTDEIQKPKVIMTKVII
jgi:hypothetical protein